MILAIVIAIWFSTSTMAILEPCLPIWLMQYLKPTKWQLGTVFIPDSIGYFVGTNFFGSIAFKYGQIKISCISLILVGISSILVSILMQNLIHIDKSQFGNELSLDTMRYYRCSTFTASFWFGFRYWYY